MNMTFGSLLAVVLVLFTLGLAAAEQPNVVVFLADDAGWGDYSHNGNRQVSTPHIDSLAERGVTLDRFFLSVRSARPLGPSFSPVATIRAQECMAYRPAKSE